MSASHIAIYLIVLAILAAPFVAAAVLIRALARRHNKPVNKDPSR